VVAAGQAAAAATAAGIVTVAGVVFWPGSTASWDGEPNGKGQTGAPDVPTSPPPQTATGDIAQSPPGLTAAPTSTTALPVPGRTSGAPTIDVNIQASEHTKNARPSTLEKHEKGQKRKEIDKRGGEKGDARRPYSRSGNKDKPQESK